MSLITNSTSMEAFDPPVEVPPLDEEVLVFGSTFGAVLPLSHELRKAKKDANHQELI